MCQLEMRSKILKETLSSSKLIIPDNVENKIRLLCSRIPNTEWSGILFCNIEGTFKTGITVVCKDILLLDIGTQVTTLVSISPEIAGYMAENPELLDCQQALIHSHHTMETFASGTDLNTLEQNAKDCNHFVSLIVNNRGSYSAFITRNSEVTVKAIKTFRYKTVKDKSIEETINDTVVKNVLSYASLPVIIEENPSIKDLKERINTLLLQPKIDSCFTRFIQDPKAYYIDKNADIKTDKDTYDKDFLINHFIMQLFSGNLFVDMDLDIDINFDEMEDLLHEMKINYEEEFPKELLSKFEQWASSYIDNLFWISQEKYKTIMSDHEFVTEVLKKLNKFKKNNYLNIFIKLLEGYDTDE